MEVREPIKSLVKILVIIIFFLFPGILIAQEDSVVSGDVIRVNTNLVGTFSELKNDSLYFKTKNRIICISLQQITKLEAARSKKSNTGKGAIIGAISCGLGFGIIAAIAVSNEQGQWLIPIPSQAFLGGFVLGSLGGGGIGAIIGSQTKSYHWQEIKIPRR